jgi:hypothetical protein
MADVQKETYVGPECRNVPETDKEKKAKVRHMVEDGVSCRKVPRPPLWTVCGIIISTDMW